MTATNIWGASPTPYEEIGGESGVLSLAESFYDIIEAESPGLRSLLPKNTANTRRKFFKYLSGWLGGPPLYEQEHGHPRLRMRHLPFRIGELEVHEWMRCMRLAMEREELPEQLRAFLDSRFEPLAEHMRNQPN